MTERWGAGLVAGAVAVVLAVSSCADDIGSEQDNVGAVERQAIGLADPYPADPSIRAREAELFGSMAARRALAWDIVAKVLAPVKLESKELDLLAAGQNDVSPTLPRWQTWYQKDELKRMFQQLYRAHGKENRKSKAPFSDEQLGGIFEWNADYLAQKGLPQDLFTSRIAKVKTQTDINGLSGAEAISYSPALIRHFFENYARILDCLKPMKAGASTSLLDIVQAVDPGLSPENHSLCFDEELPIDAALTKAFWSSQLVQPEMPTFDTSAAAMTKRYASTASSDGGWGTGDGRATPGPSEIHTLSLKGGESYRLAALHVVTKELRHWMWITLWWSPEPDNDFGADRPTAMAELGGIWKSYKMCVASFFDEGDPDPRGGYPTAQAFEQALAAARLRDGDALPPDLARMKNLVSLGDVLEATHRGVGGPTHCSNPYLEEGPLNARSNCIGCHQHAGTPIEALDVLSNERAYPGNGNLRVRNNHPADYLWAFDKEARLGRIIQVEVAQQDLKDGKP